MAAFPDISLERGMPASPDAERSILGAILLENAHFHEAAEKKLTCDDFSLDSSIVSLLRSKALRLVKIDPKLTSVALKDKLAQAMVVAIAQAVKVLGIHCAAKRVESQAALQWLTAIGCDFAQGPVLAQVQPLETLGTQPAATPGTA